MHANKNEIYIYIIHIHTYIYTSIYLLNYIWYTGVWRNPRLCGHGTCILVRVLALLLEPQRALQARGVASGADRASDWGFNVSICLRVKTVAMILAVVMVAHTYAVLQE